MLNSSQQDYEFATDLEWFIILVAISDVLAEYQCLRSARRYVDSKECINTNSNKKSFQRLRKLMSGDICHRFRIHDM